MKISGAWRHAGNSIESILAGWLVGLFGLVCWLVGLAWLVGLGWLVGWFGLVVWLVGWLASCLVGCSAASLVGWLVSWLAA